MNELKKHNTRSVLLIIALFTFFMEIGYGYAYAKNSTNGAVLIYEALAFLLIQGIILLILKLTKALSTQRALDICVGVFGLAHSVFMAALVAQRISTNIETIFFVLCLFAIADALLILIWLCLRKRNSRKKSDTPEFYGRKRTKVITILSFMGAFAGIIITKITGYNIIVFDIMIAVLSLIYTAFVGHIKKK